VADHLQTKALVNFLLLDEPSAALIFTKMKQQTEEVAEALRNAGLAADYLHGDLNQGARNRIMSSFKEGKLRYLVATDVAARGIDVEDMPLVVHMGIPHSMEGYIHRSGRTGRAGAKGTSMALVSFKESRILLAWSRRGGLRLDWRAVPTRAEIRNARGKRLGERVGKQEAPGFLDLAHTMLSEREPAPLVAALLSLIEDEAHGGFDMPDTTKAEPRREKKVFAPRPGERPGWSPGEPSRPYTKPKPGAAKPSAHDDKAHGPRKGLSPFKSRDDKGAVDRRPGKPFRKKD